MANLTSTTTLGNIGDWQGRHNAAIGRALDIAPSRQPAARRMDISVSLMLHAWSEYANGHRALYESTIGEDYVLGPQWKEIGLGIRGLLNGETGPLDCGTLDGYILDTLNENGFDTENL